MLNKNFWFWYDMLSRHCDSQTFLYRNVSINLKSIYAKWNTCADEAEICVFNSKRAVENSRLNRAYLKKYFLWIKHVVKFSFTRALIGIRESSAVFSPLKPVQIRLVTGQNLYVSLRNALIEWSWFICFFKFAKAKAICPKWIPCENWFTFNTLRIWQMTNDDVNWTRNCTWNKKLNGKTKLSLYELQSDLHGPSFGHRCVLYCIWKKMKVNKS